MKKQILLLGGSGRTGGFVIEKALAAGHKVNALVRNPNTITTSHENLTLIKGTPTSSTDVATAMQGCDAVLVTLNNSRASDSPFAKTVNSDTLLTDSISNTIEAMNEQGVKRISMLGVAGASESFASSPWYMRMMIKRTNLGQAYRDHEGVEALFSASKLDWTVGRAMMLGKKAGTLPVIESYVVGNAVEPKPAMQISRESVANWLIESLERVDLNAKAPIISQK